MGEEQESGVRMKSICFLLSADCLLLTAFKGGAMEWAVRKDGSPGQDVAAEWERRN